MFFYCWSKSWPLQQCGEECGIVSWSTIVDYANFCREVCARWLDLHGSNEIGGFRFNDDGEMIPVIVEIDESQFGKRKYNRGRLNNERWIFGGIERHSGRCFLIEVEDRSRATLERHIMNHILPGSHIVSDGWSSYYNIENMNNSVYTHSTVIHEHNFVDPENPHIHTQNIENT